MTNKFIYSLTIASTLFLTACSGDGKTSETTESTSQTKSKISNESTKPSNKTEVYVSPLPDSAPTYTVAMMEFPPYRFRDEYGTEIGYEVDLLHAISEEAGFKTKIKTEPFSNIFTSIQKGDNDFAMFALTLTPERQEVMLASQPYSVVQTGYLVTSNSPYQDIEGLSGKKIATLAGSSLQTELEKEGVTEIIGKPTLFLSFQTIFTGEAEAVFSEQPALMYASQQFPEHPSRFMSTGNETQMVAYAGKDKKELIDEINVAIDAIITNGKYQKIHEKWFQKSASDMMIDKAKNR